MRNDHNTVPVETRGKHNPNQHGSLSIRNKNNAVVGIGSPGRNDFFAEAIREDWPRLRFGIHNSSPLVDSVEHEDGHDETLGFSTAES